MYLNQCFTLCNCEVSGLKRKMNIFHKMCGVSKVRYAKYSNANV